MTTCLVLLLLGMMTDEEKLPITGTVVHRPVHAAERDAFAALPKIALIAEKPQPSLAKLAQQASGARTSVACAKPLYLLAAGPTLDSPDRVEVHSLTRQDDKVTLRIRHTSARLSGSTLRRNIHWHPLVQVPLELSPGKWKVIVEWTPYSDLPNGKPLAKPTIDTAQFEIAAKTSR